MKGKIRVGEILKSNVRGERYFKIAGDEKDLLWIRKEIITLYAGG